MSYETPVTVTLSNPNWQLNPAVGFAEVLDIVQPSDFDDEPTIPWGLCREIEVEESDIIDELPTWMRTVLNEVGE